MVWLSCEWSGCHGNSAVERSGCHVSGLVAVQTLFGCHANIGCCANIGCHVNIAWLLCEHCLVAM